MNRELLEKGLVEAEHRLARAERHLDNQLEFVARLEHDGRDPSQALALSHQFEQLHAMHTADRDRLSEELGSYQTGSFQFSQTQQCRTALDRPLVSLASDAKSRSTKSTGRRSWIPSMSPTRGSSST
jgi:hypothetical protein